MKSVSTRQKKSALGEVEAQLLAALDALRGPGARLEDAARLVRGPRSRFLAASKRLVSKGHLVRLARGRYYRATEDPARAACHAWAPSYVSFLTVLADAGLTDQIPRRLDLAYAQPVLRRKEWAGLPITWHPVPPDAFRGYSETGDGVLEATPAKAAADLVHRQRDFGGLTPYRDLVRAALRTRPAGEVEQALRAYKGQPGALRRLLYLQSERCVPPRWAATVRRLDLHNPLRLDLTLPPKPGPPHSPLNVQEPDG